MQYSAAEKLQPNQAAANAMKLAASSNSASFLCAAFPANGSIATPAQASAPISAPVKKLQSESYIFLIWFFFSLSHKSSD